MPLRVDLPDVSSIRDVPAGWHVVYPDQYNASTPATSSTSRRCCTTTCSCWVCSWWSERPSGAADRRTVRRGGSSVALIGVVARTRCEPVRMDWLPPTRRVVRWSPLMVVAALASGTLVLVPRRRLAIAGSPSRIVFLAMLVIGALCGLHDPAREFVHPLPVVGRSSPDCSAWSWSCRRSRCVAAREFVGERVVRGGAAGSRMAGLGGVRNRRRRCVRSPDPPARHARVDGVVSGMVVWLVAALSADRIDAPIDLVAPWSRWPVAFVFVGARITVVATTCGVEA